MYAYELLDENGGHVEYRTTTEPLTVGPGAHGEQALMREIDPASLPASPPVPPEPRAWLERLGPDKQAAIMTAALANATVLLWVMKASGSRDIDVTAQETIDGVNALVAVSVLTSDDAAILLAS